MGTNREEWDMLQTFRPYRMVAVEITDGFGKLSNSLTPSLTPETIYVPLREPLEEKLPRGCFPSALCNG